MKFFDNLSSFAQNPAAVIGGAISRREVRLAIWGYVAGALSIMLMSGLYGAKTVSVFGFFMGFMGFLFFNLCLGFFFAASAHLFLELTTGKGSAVGLFILFGLSEFTKALLVALALTSAAVPALDGIRWLIVILILILQLMFILYMMQRIYGISKIKTFGALAISFVPSVISFFAAGFLFILFIFWLIFK